MFQCLLCKIQAYFAVLSVYCELFSWHPSFKYWSYELCQHQLASGSSTKQGADSSECQNLEGWGPTDGRFHHGSYHFTGCLATQPVSISQPTYLCKAMCQTNLFQLVILFCRHLDTHSLPKPVPRAYPLLRSRILVSHLIFRASAVLHTVSWSPNFSSKHICYRNCFGVLGVLLHVTSSPAYLGSPTTRPIVMEMC